MKFLTKLLMLGATSTALGGMLYAEPKAGSPAPVVAPTATDAAKKLTPAEMQVHVASLDTQMKEDYRHVLHLKSVSEGRKDVIKVNCVNDRLVSIKAQLNIADTTGVELQAALAHSGDTRFDLYVSYSSAAASVKAAREEANGCVGEAEIVTQAGAVEVHHPEIPDDPVVTNPFLYSHEIEAPAYASPFD